MQPICSAAQPWGAAGHRAASPRFSSFLGARHGLMCLQAQSLRGSSGVVARSRRAALATRVAAVPLASAQPVLRVAGHLAARVVGSGALLNLARSARGALSGRAGPFVFAGLLAYSVAVTLYAAQAASRASSATAAGGSSTAVAESPELEAPESFAEAVAASALADLPPVRSFPELDRKLERLQAGAAVAVASPAAVAVASPAAVASAAQPAAKKEDRVVCKVCNGKGQVAYENHMMLYDGTVCPCCLGKGTVKNKRGDLISCLLTFDP